MRIFLSVIIFIHALIHLVGFIRAFNLFAVSGFNTSISKLWGITWLIGSILLIITAVFYLNQHSYWMIVAIPAVIISQILIFAFWKDAMYGSILNVLLIIIITNQVYRQSSIALEKDEEINAMTKLAIPLSTDTLFKKDLTLLPEPVQRWLNNSGIVNKPVIETISLKQKCWLKLNVDQENWYEANARQFFITKTPSFVWKMNMKLWSFITVSGRDKLADGKGQMLINLFSILPIVDEHDNDKINQGTLQRYLGEIVWFPSAAVSPYIHWEAIDSHSAKATIEVGQTKGSGVFYFAHTGKFMRFVCDRYMGSGEEAKKYKWEIKANDWKEMNGVIIPTRLDAIWHLEKKNWTWAKFELTSICYNCKP